MDRDAAARDKETGSQRRIFAGRFGVVRTSLLPPVDRPAPVSLADVSIDDGFWNDRLATNRETTVEHQHEQLEERCLPNFRRVRDGKVGGFQGMCFEDSDAYRWLEAASSVLATREEPDLREQVDEVVALDGEARVVSTEDWGGQLYRERDDRDDGWTSVWVPTG